MEPGPARHPGPEPRVTDAPAGRCDIVKGEDDEQTWTQAQGTQEEPGESGQAPDCWLSPSDWPVAQVRDLGQNT